MLDTLETDEEENGYHTPWDAKGIFAECSRKSRVPVSLLGDRFGSSMSAIPLRCHGELTGQTERFSAREGAHLQSGCFGYWAEVVIVQPVWRQ